MPPWRRSELSNPADGMEVFLRLRSRALGLDPATVNLAPDADLPNVFGVVMDTTYDNGTATLVAVAEGTTSLYASSGGGVIGGGQQESVASASRRLLLTAEANLAHFAPAEGGDLPAVGHVRIALLTYSGQRAVVAREDDLLHRRHPAAHVFHAVHTVITALRTIEQGTRSAGARLPGGATPLMAAAYGGHVEAVAGLLDQGIPIDAHDDSGYTALMFAANAGRDEAVRVLLARGADPNAVDRQGTTPLMFAAQHDHLGIVRQLLAAGADPTARGDHGLTPLGFARQNRHRQTAEVLTAAGASD